MSKTKKLIKKIKTRVGIYDATFESNTPQKGYTVEVPKLKGVVTFGDSLKEAEKNVKEAIELHFSDIIEMPWEWRVAGSGSSTRSLGVQLPSLPGPYGYPHLNLT